MCSAHSTVLLLYVVKILSNVVVVTQGGKEFPLRAHFGLPSVDAGML